MQTLHQRDNQNMARDKNEPTMWLWLQIFKYTYGPSICTESLLLRVPGAAGGKSTMPLLIYFELHHLLGNKARDWTPNFLPQ